MKLFSQKPFKQKAKRFVCLFLLLLLALASVGSFSPAQNQAQAAIDWNNGSYWRHAKFTLDIQNHALVDIGHNPNVVYKWLCFDTKSGVTWFNGNDNAHFFKAEGSSTGVIVIPNGANRAVVRAACTGLKWEEAGGDQGNINQADFDDSYEIDSPLEISNWQTYSLGSRLKNTHGDCGGKDTSFFGNAHAYDEQGNDITDKASDDGTLKNNAGRVDVKWIADGGDQSTKLFNTGEMPNWYSGMSLKGGYEMKLVDYTSEGSPFYPDGRDAGDPNHPLNNLLPWGTYKMVLHKDAGKIWFSGYTYITGEMKINFDNGGKPDNPQFVGPTKADKDGKTTDALWGGKADGSVCNFDFNLSATDVSMLERVMKFILGIAKEVIDWVLDFVDRIIMTYAIIDTSKFLGEAVKGNWIILRDICNVLFVFVLLGIAFMNFFGEGIDAYTIKKLLPRFLIAIIIINFSLLMCKVIVDFSNVLSQTFQSIGNIGNVIEPAKNISNDISVGTAGAQFGSAIVSIILAVIGAIAGLLLAFLLIFRLVMIWLLVMISPFVFLLWVLPPTQTLFTKWWDNFIKYVFMGPVVVLILALAQRVNNIFDSAAAGDKWIMLLFSSGMIIAAAAVPLALGGMAMQKVSGAIRSVGKKVGGVAWGATGAKAAARAKEGYMARVGEKRGLIGKIPRSPRARAKASAELSKVRAPIYDQMNDETTLAKKAKRGDVQAALMLARHERTDLLDPNMVAKHPSLQQMVKTQDPIGAGLKDDALKSFLDKADASQFTGTGVKNLLESNQELSDHHISAIATRGNQSAIDALHEHYATHKMPSADSVAGRAVLHSALASKNATQGSKIINNMNAADFGTYLRHASPNQVVEWQNSGVIDNLSPESLKELKGWGETNKVSLEALQDKGEISKDFFSKITKSKITK